MTIILQQFQFMEDKEAGLQEIALPKYNQQNTIISE